MGRYLIIYIFFLTSASVFSQETKQDSIATKKADSLATSLKGKGIVVDEVRLKKPINPLAPSKAAFLSAILPGLGQIYNKRYWKVPIVWGAIGTGVAVYSFNNSQFNRARDELKTRLAGLQDSQGDPGLATLDIVDLEDTQERIQRNRDLSLLVTVLLYALNVVDANVDAHLKQFNVDEKLAMDFKPYLDYNEITAQPNFGMTLVVKF